MNYRFFLSLTLLLSLTLNAKHFNLEKRANFSPNPLLHTSLISDSSDLVKYNRKEKDFSKKGVYLITTTFNNLEVDQENIPTLFIGPSSYSVIVKLNNTEIYRWGEFKNPVSMTNFGASIVVLPNVNNNVNKLDLYFYSDGKDLPLPKFYIDDYNKVAFSSSLQTLFNLYFIQGIAIIALFSGILFFAYSAASRFKQLDILYFSFFAFSIFFGYSHFIMNSPVSDDLLWFKISRIGYVFAALLLFLFCSEYTGYIKNNLIKTILALINSVIVIIYSLSKSQAILNNHFSTFSTLYILPLLFIGYILLWKSVINNRKISTKLIILGYTLFMLGTIHDISCIVRKVDPYFWITPYGYFFLITSIIFAVVLRYYNEINEKIIAQQKLKISEEKYRQVYDAPNDGIFIQDPETLKILDANKVSQKMFGYTEKEIKSLNIADLSSNISPYTIKEVKQHTENLLKSNKVQTFEWHAKRKNGELFWVEVHIKKTVIANNNRILVFIRDITLRNKLEENLRQSQKMEAIGTLAGGVAHDFNNILSGIIGFTELTLMEAKDNKLIQSNLNEIMKGSERARELVQQILTFSRKKSPEKKPISLKLLVEESAKLLRSSIPVNIKFDINLKSNALVNANATQIHQLILNLCTNAYHSMQNNGGTLYINLSDEYVQSENTMLGTKLKIGDYVKLEISDTGNGIPQSIIKKIFDPYFTTKEEGNGTGLGLSVVHGIIKDHKGEISVYSEENKGTTFNIYFPISKISRKSFRNGDFQSINYSGTENILFVDDEETIVNLVSKVLPKYGYEVTTCSNGDEAWKLYKESSNRFDLIITDMTMPGMSGLDLSRKILKEDNNMPIIICSGYSNFIDDKIAKEENISALISKPVNIRDLLQNIRSVLNTN